MYFFFSLFKIQAASAVIRTYDLKKEILSKNVNSSFHGNIYEHFGVYDCKFTMKKAMLYIKLPAVLFIPSTLRESERERIEALILSLHISGGCKSSFSKARGKRPRI